MAKHFFSLSTDEQAALIQQAGVRLDLTDLIIEKDLWVCWLLEQIFALPIHAAFKGGTSLSKVFGLINRFSEDCDITIDYRNFKPDLKLADLNRTQLKKISAELKAQLQSYIAKVVLPYLQEQVAKLFQEETFEIELSEDGEQLRFYYPSLINPLRGYLRDHVLIEFGVRNSTEPCEKHRVVSYLAQSNPDPFILPNPVVDALSPIRTFWEKATLIHVECHRNRFSTTPERLSRHWYDLFMLNNAWVGPEALSHLEILKSVIEHKKAFFNASYTHYDDCLSGKFLLVPTGVALENLKQDFKQMLAAGMFHKLPPTFKTIIEGLEQLENRLNRLEMKF